MIGVQSLEIFHAQNSLETPEVKAWTISFETFILCLLFKHYPMERDSQASNYSTFYDNIDQIPKDQSMKVSLN